LGDTGIVKLYVKASSAAAMAEVCSFKLLLNSIVSSLFSFQSPQAANATSSREHGEIWRALLRLCWSSILEQPSVISSRSRTNRYL